MLPSRPHQILTPIRSYTLHHRSPPSRSSPAVAAVLSPVSSPVPPVSSPPDSVATRRFSSRLHNLFNVFSKSAIAKFRNVPQTKMADVDSNIQHRHITLKNHCTLLVRWPLGIQMQNLFIKIRCFMEKIIFQLLSCLYLYDSVILVPTCIRKQSQSTDFWRLALIYRAVGLPTSGAGIDIPCRWSTDFWRRREVCAKSIDRLLASKVLILLNARR